MSKIFKAQYKKEALDKCSEEDFNGVDEDLAPKFKYNDTWFSRIKKKYLATVNKMDDMLENIGNNDNAPEEKEEGKAVKALQEAAKNERLRKRIETEKDSIESFIASVVKQVKDTELGQLLPVTAQSLQLSL